MAVTSRVELPNQPNDGSLVLHALGGDGFTGPHSVYHGLEQITGDASGGLLTCSVRFDPRFTQLVIQMQCAFGGLSADKDFDMQISESTGSILQVRATATYLPITGIVTDASKNWNPGPYLLSAGPGDSVTLPWMQWRAVNDGVGVDMYCRFHVYNFDKRAREEIPIEILSRALVRAESLI